MQLSEIRRVLAPDTLPYPSGVERLPDGMIHVAVLTRMPGVTPDMIAWWFGTYMQTSEHYRRWHPRDHVWMDWADKRPGTHIGASHLVHEYIGGQLQKLRITFLDPKEYLGDDYSDGPDTLAICAHNGFLGRPVRMSRMVHFCRATDWGMEMHSRFWLGSFTAGGLLAPLGGLLNTPLVRRLALPMKLGRALSEHCHEEMTTLAGFLPALYREETGGA